MISFFKLVSILLFSFLVTPLYAASFDCKKATSETEITVCFDLGYQAFEKEEFQEAFDFWKPLADAGEAHAQYNIAQLYYGNQQSILFSRGEFFKGYGINQNAAREDAVEEAVKWYLLSAKQGVIDAQFNLSVIYELEFGDEVMGRKWAELAAKNGHIKAQWNISGSFDCNKAKTETEKAICRTAGGDSVEEEFSDSMQIAGEWSMKKLPAKMVCDLENRIPDIKDQKIPQLSIGDPLIGKKLANNTIQRISFDFIDNYLSLNFYSTQKEISACSPSIRLNYLNLDQLKNLKSSGTSQIDILYSLNSKGNLKVYSGFYCTGGTICSFAQDDTDLTLKVLNDEIKIIGFDYSSWYHTYGGSSISANLLTGQTILSKLAGWDDDDYSGEGDRKIEVLSEDKLKINFPDFYFKNGDTLITPLKIKSLINKAFKDRVCCGDIRFK